MEFLTNLRFALGQMRKRWVLTLGAAISLALCLGLNTAVFSVFNAALLRPLPFPEPDRIVEVFNSYSAQGIGKASSGQALYTVYKEEIEAIGDFALVGGRAVTFGGSGRAQLLQGLQVTPDFFSTIQMVPALGQSFRPENGLPGNERVVILTHGFWQSAFAGDPGVLGREIQLDSQGYIVLGVLPADFRRFKPDIRVILPYSWNPADVDLNHRHSNYAMLLGRLAKGATVAQAQSQVDAVDEAYRESNPDYVGFLDRSGHKSWVKLHEEERVQAVRGAIVLLQMFALAILIIGSLNIANLRMAEVAGRERELTLRRVMGGSRGALLRQLLTEAGLLGVLGGALGLVTAWLSLSLMRNSFAGLVPDTESITLDGAVLVWALALVLATILIVGLFPARLLWRLNYQTLLQEGGRGSASGRGAALRSSLGVIQTGLAVLLLIATGLFVRSFWSVSSVSPGFETENVSTFRISLPETTYPDADAHIAMVRRVLDQLRALPGVEQVAGATSVPVVQGMSTNALSVRGEELSNEQVQKGADNFSITEGFFETLGIPLLDGRGIEITDTEERNGVFVVDRTFGDRYLPEGVVGGRFTFGRPPDDDDDWPNVVGQASPIIHRALTDLNRAPLVYHSYYQSPSSSISFLIRSDRSHESLLADARQVIAGIDPQLPLYETGRLDEMINDSLQERRGILGLTLLFAAVALLLAVAGIYGVQAYNLQAERRTFAIHAALGATPGHLLRRTLARGLAPVGLGLLVGLAAAVFLAPYAAELLFSVEPRDPLSFALVPLFVLLVSTIVLLFPAAAAARSDPGRILHEE